MVATVGALITAAAVAISVRTANDLANAQLRLGTLEFVQRERNSHVNRAVEQEVVILCAAAGGGGCVASGDTIVAYRSPIPVVFPPPAANELSRTTFDGADGAQISFTPGPALFVDAFARSVDLTGVPVDQVMNIVLRGGGTEDIVFRADGVAIPSFEAPSAIEVAPHISDVGSRTTPNPTPQTRPNTSYRARKVFLE
jgi:hypothetical protein